MVSSIEMLETSADPQKVSGIVDAVRRDGICLVPAVFSAAECKGYCGILEDTLRGLSDRGEYCGSSMTQVIYNYFIHDARLYPLFAHPLMDAVMQRLIDKDYVLISPSARNPRLLESIPADRITSGDGWHVDSRVADPATGALYRPSFSYYSVVALEPFRKENSATHYLPRSHLRYQRPPDRNAAYEYDVMEADAGSVVFFDSALWHRTGLPTPTSRWSIFNMYGPWFLKPYFRFSENLDRPTMEKMPPTVQRLLHLFSTPPRDSNARINTVTKTPVFD